MSTASSRIWQQVHQNRKTTSLVAVFAVALLLRSSTTGRRKRRLSLLPERVSPEEISKAEQQLYVAEADGSHTLLIPFRGRIEKISIKPIPQEQLINDAKDFPPPPANHKAQVDKIFLRQLRAVLNIVFPSWRSKGMFMVLLHTAFLVFRTVLSVWVAKLDGRLVRDLVRGDGPGFLKGLGLWFALAIPSTYTNSMLRFLQSKLALHMRTQLTRYTHDVYLSNMKFYHITQPGGLEGVDQYITSDIASFCESLSALYGNIMKPTLDMFIFTAQLARSLGFRGTTILYLNYYITVRILRAVTPAFGRLAAMEAMLEGEYRAGMNRIVRHSEEIAFYGGELRERSIIFDAYLRLIKHVESIFKLRIAYEWTEDFVIKYAWSAAGYGLISIPMLFTRRKRSVGVQAPTSKEGTDDAVASRTEDYISSRRLLMSLADAGGRLMYAYKDISELAGLTTRIYNLLSTLHNLPSIPSFSHSPSMVALKHVDIVVPSRGAADEKACLVEGLEVELDLNKGEHLMITGSNGVGKTAIARVIAGLWEAKGGQLIRPERGVQGVFVVPQRAYMVAGTLLDQVIYPHSYTEYLASGTSESELLEILKAVRLEYLPEREGGWHARKEWRDVLSGGEKQRMGMARVFYHLPKVAVLDECTSAVSSDVEGSMYEHAKSLGISLITISLRPSLAKYHTHVLTLNGDGSGGWNMTRVGTAEERMSFDKEIISLENKLAEVQNWEQRVKELTVLLSTPDSLDDSENFMTG